jgi:hypothetical protein
MDELTNRVVELADVVGGAARRWTATLMSARSWSVRIAEAGGAVLRTPRDRPWAYSKLS